MPDLRSATLLCAVLLLCAGGVLADAPIPAAAPSTLDLKTATLSYTLQHKLHQSRGVCAQAEGRAAVAPDGLARVQVRAKVACFDSGDGNRDVHMREVTHEALHPYVTVRGTVEGVALPLAGPLERTLNAKVELNGVSQAAPVALLLRPDGPRLRGTFKVELSLEGFQIERPSLLLVKVEDKLVVEGELLFEPAR
jgi:hypothetical protein